AVVPAVDLAKSAANERRQERAQVDPHVEDRERAVATRVARRVEVADLGGDVGLEAAVAEDEEQQREQEEPLESHQEVADGHQDAAQDDRLALAEDAVGE